MQHKMYSIKCIIGRRADKPIFFKNSNAPDTSRIVLRTVWFVKFRRLNRRSGYSQMLDTICTKKGVRAAIMNNPVLSHVQPLLRISLSLSLSLSLSYLVYNTQTFSQHRYIVCKQEAICLWRRTFHLYCWGTFSFVSVHDGCTELFRISPISRVWSCGPKCQQSDTWPGFTCISFGAKS